MKITKTGTPSKRRLTLNDITFGGGEVVEVGGRVYLYPISGECEIEYSGYETHTVFIDLANGELVPLRDDQECYLIKDVEFKYNADNLVEWVE
jgi:hypothetical protein